jgi:hypothetical protein
MMLACTSATPFTEATTGTMPRRPIALLTPAGMLTE